MSYREISTEEVQRLIPLARSGDRDAWERLAWLYDPFIAKVARWYDQRTRGTYDDIYQVGQIGLKRAIDGYDPSRAAFSTYATQHIHAAAQQEYRRYRGGRTAERVQIVSWDEPVDLGDGLEPSAGTGYANTIPDPEPDAEQVCVRGRMLSHINDLASSAVTTGAEYVVMQARLLSDDPATLNEVGDILNCSREWVRQVERRVLQRLSVVLTDAEDDDG